MSELEKPNGEKETPTHAMNPEEDAKHEAQQGASIEALEKEIRALQDALRAEHQALRDYAETHRAAFEAHISKLSTELAEMRQRADGEIERLDQIDGKLEQLITHLSTGRAP